MSNLYNNETILFGFSNIVEMLDSFISNKSDNTCLPNYMEVKLYDLDQVFIVINGFKINQNQIDELYDYFYENSNDVYDDFSFSNAKKFDCNFRSNFISIGF